MLPQLTTCFQRLNKELFENQLPAPEFISDPNRAGILSFISPSTIGFCQNFPDASRRAILDDLLHQMIHFEYHQRGIEDHTSNQYHKKEFCTRALEVGLNVLFNSSRGWAITTSLDDESDKLRKSDPKAAKRLAGIYGQITSLMDVDELQDFQNQLRTEFQTRQRQSKQYQLKYICSCLPPHNTIRSGRRPDGQRPLDAICNTCGAKFVYSVSVDFFDCVNFTSL